MNQKKLINIGLQIPSLSDSYSNELIDCINTTATILNVNLIIFLVGHPDKATFKHEYHQRVIYDHINSDNLDAVILLSGTLGNYISEPEFENIIKQFTSIPIISIGIDISNFVSNQSSILVNSEGGLGTLIEHLIFERNYSDLAFITGPLDNPEALMRFETYKKILNKHNIKIKPQNIYYGNFDSTDAPPAVDQFLANNQQPEVIICSNDHCALGVLEELSKRNIRVPQQIAVTGFDNVEGTNNSNPPLSTVSQPFVKMGSLATNLAVRKALNKSCDKVYTLDTIFIKRQSCGHSFLDNFRFINYLIQLTLSPFTLITNIQLKINNSDSPFEVITKITDKILKKQNIDVDKSVLEFEGKYLIRLKKRIKYDIRMKSGFDQWMLATEQVEQKYNIQSNTKQVVDLILLRIIDMLIKENELSRDSDLSSRDSIYFVKDIIEEISDSNSFDELSKKLRSRYNQLFHFINLENYIVLTYPTPIKKFKNSTWVTPKTIDVMLSFNDINNKNIKNIKGFNAKYLFPKELTPNNKRYTLVVETLYSANYQLGRVVYKLYPRELDLFSCAMITSQIASTIRIIHQSNDRKKSQKKIDLLVSDLETKKIIAEEATVAKGRFLATMSHEIRTPMNGVLGMTQLLKGTKLNKEQNEFLEIIQTSSNSLLNIISDILDFSKIDEGKLELEIIEFDLETICLEVISLFNFNVNQHDIQLNLDIDNKISNTIKSDPTRLRQILINLIGNAFKFTEKGSITLKVEPLLNTHNKINKNEQLLKISIIDTGIGISKENTEQLFGAFNQADSSTTRKFGGTGLGLSISKSLAELMGGDIGINSTLGQGSTFWFTIISRSITSFSSPKIELKKNKITAEHIKKLIGKEILVAEDNKVNQMVIRGMINKLGANVTISGNGQEVFDIFTNSVNKFDLILMDFEMPILDGASATKKIRQFEQNFNDVNDNKLHIPIIAITAHAMNEHRELCILSGMDDHLSKPIDLETLQQMLIRFL
ncbi:MAG: substrate-binding domain-containing protein [Saccharospirillaceae bacterium]|nr:ATP-binding protein [Pseudomonadales bacterium]NRB78309.1 substrate-binding domain-containing protein [Saccharospirillaceae bacterium]